MNTFLITKDKIIIFSFICFIFLWSYNIFEYNLFRYFILIPFIISFLDFKKLKELNILNFILIPSILILHYIFINLYYNQELLYRDLLAIIFLSIVIFTYLIHRDFIKDNFILILKIYFILLLIFSLVLDHKVDTGSCSNNLFNYVPFLKNFSLSAAFFSENSHLAMINIGAIMSSFYYFFKKKDYLLLILVVFSLLINIFNLSTTFLLGYILCSIIFIIFTKNNYFKFFLIITSSLFFIIQLIGSDCNKKYKHINIEDIKNEKLKRVNGSLTSKIYERSIILSLKTLKNKPLGWGYDGTVKATEDYFKQRKLNNLHMDLLIWKLNYKDALGNLFKLIIEFGFLTLILIPLFINFIRKNKISEYEIFVISLFFVQIFRGAGYLNGGFIIAFTELFIVNFIIHKEINNNN